jgi:hypothetical protein
MTGGPFFCDLSQHPDYAQRVGVIVSVWAQVEMRLSVIFGILLRAPVWTAWDAFFSLQNSKARTDMIRSLATGLDDRLPERQALLDLVERCSRAAGPRNAYAHRSWILERGKLYQLDKPAVPVETSLKHHVSLKNMDADIAALRKLETDLRDFLIVFGNKYPLRLERDRHDPEPWPGKWPGHTPRPKRGAVQKRPDSPVAAPPQPQSSGE